MSYTGDLTERMVNSRTVIIRIFTGEKTDVSPKMVIQRDI